MKYVGKGLISVATGILLFLAWTLWGTGLYEGRRQSALERQFESIISPTPAPTGTDTTPPTAQDRGPPRGYSPAPGDPVMRIRIPAIGLSKIVVEGVGPEQLRLGPGHYPSCRPDFPPPLCTEFAEAWPGLPGRVVISGHRTTYGAPFSAIDRLQRGDRVSLETAWGARFTYEVTHLEVVLPSSPNIVSEREEPELILTTCHPRFSAARRLVVYAKPRLGQ
jgi:sortase A